MKAALLIGVLMAYWVQPLAARQVLLIGQDGQISWTGRVEGAERVVGEVPEAVQFDALDLHASSSTSKAIAIASASCSSAAKSPPCGASSPMKRKRWLP